MNWDALPYELWQPVYEAAVHGDHMRLHAAVVEYASMDLTCHESGCDEITLPGDIWCRWHGPRGEEAYYED